MRGRKGVDPALGAYEGEVQGSGDAVVDFFVDGRGDPGRLAKLMSSKDFDTLYAAGAARAIGDWLLGDECHESLHVALREREERVVDRAGADPDVGSDCRSAESNRAIQTGNLLGSTDGLPGEAGSLTRKDVSR